jgi:uncharacterized protein (DUF433 family)
MLNTLADSIESTPGICGGKPRIAGTRVRVQDIAAWHELHGRSVDAIASGYPHIGLPAIYAALAYYHAHRDQILADLKADEEFVAKFRADYDAAGRRNGTDANGNPLSPR